MKGHTSDSLSCETQISAVILDLDGTLLNTEKATETVLKDFLAQYGRKLDSGKEESRFGKTQNESAASIVKDYNLQMTGDEFTNEIMPWYKARWPEVKALPGANRLITHLHKHGIPFALASNSIRKHIEEKISYQTGWWESFSVILGSDEVNSGKPSPDIFLEAAKRMHVDPTHCLVIEDSFMCSRHFACTELIPWISTRVGVQAAKASGMKGCKMHCQWNQCASKLYSAEHPLIVPCCLAQFQGKLLLSLFLIKFREFTLAGLESALVRSSRWW